LVDLELLPAGQNSGLTRDSPETGARSGPNSMVGEGESALIT